MKKRMIIVAIAAGLVALIGGAAWAYGELKEMAAVEPNFVLRETPSPSDGAKREESQTPSNETPSSSETRPDETAGASGEEEQKEMIAPDFTVLDAQGNEVKLSELFGKPIVLNFWASWCPPCKSEMPDFNKLYEELGEDVHFVMVDAVDGERETQETGAAYVEQEGYTFPVYYDVNQEAVMGYGIRAFPTSLFIDKNGYLVTGAEGAIDEKTLRRGIGLILPEEE